MPNRARAIAAGTLTTLALSGVGVAFAILSPGGDGVSSTKTVQPAAESSPAPTTSVSVVPETTSVLPRSSTPTTPVRMVSVLPTPSMTSTLSRSSSPARVMPLAAPVAASEAPSTTHPPVPRTPTVSASTAAPRPSASATKPTPPASLTPLPSTPAPSPTAPAEPSPSVTTPF